MRRCAAAVMALVILGALGRADDPIAEDEKLLRSQGIANDGPGLLDYFRKQTLSEADRRQIGQWIVALGDRRFATREKASKELLQRGRAARPFLRAALQAEDPEVRRRAQDCLDEIERGPGSHGDTAIPLAGARLLRQRAPAQAITVLLAYLPQADDADIEETILETLVSLSPRTGRVDPVLLSALEDSSALRRGAAAWVLGRHGEAKIRLAVQKLLTDRAWEVRYRASYALLVGGERSALSPLIDLLMDVPLSRAWVIEDGLYRLAGEHSPSTSLGDGSREMRAACHKAWRGWLESHGTKVELARLESTPDRMLGFTLGIEYNTSRVWECGLDGKTRWEIRNVQGPMDAWVVKNNRVLLVDQNGISERDFQGKILWTAKVSDPNGCQRLPNGHTFVSSYSSVLELDREGKELYKHTIPGSNAIRMHRNGTILYVRAEGIVRMDRSGKQLGTVPLPREGMWVGIEDLPNDRYLVANSGSGRVVEVDATGKILWEGKVAGACGVTRLPNGHTLVAAPMHVVQLDREGKVVWEKKAEGYVRRVHRR